MAAAGMDVSQFDMELQKLRDASGPLVETTRALLKEVFGIYSVTEVTKDRSYETHVIEHRDGKVLHPYSSNPRYSVALAAYLLEPLNSSFTDAGFSFLVPVKDNTADEDISKPGSFYPYEGHSVSDLFDTLENVHRSDEVVEVTAVGKPARCAYVEELCIMADPSFQPIVSARFKEEGTREVVVLHAVPFDVAADSRKETLRYAVRLHSLLGSLKDFLRVEGAVLVREHPDLDADEMQPLFMARIGSVPLHQREVIELAVNLIAHAEFLRVAGLDLKPFSEALKRISTPLGIEAVPGVVVSPTAGQEVPGRLGPLLPRTGHFRVPSAVALSLSNVSGEEGDAAVGVKNPDDADFPNFDWVRSQSVTIGSRSSPVANDAEMSGVGASGLARVHSGSGSDGSDDASGASVPSSIVIVPAVPVVVSPLAAMPSSSGDGAPPGRRASLVGSALGAVAAVFRLGGSSGSVSSSSVTGGGASVGSPSAAGVAAGASRRASVGGAAGGLRSNWDLPALAALGVPVVDGKLVSPSPPPGRQRRTSSVASSGSGAEEGGGRPVASSLRASPAHRRGSSAAAGAFIASVVGGLPPPRRPSVSTPAPAPAPAPASGPAT